MPRRRRAWLRAGGDSIPPRRAPKSSRRDDACRGRAIELGSKVGALVGLGIEGEEGLEAGAEAGAEAAADGVQVFSDDDAWDVLEEIPNDSAAALVLIEHQWAVPLRDAVMRAGGHRVADGFISPLDLVEIGLATAEEAEQLHAHETAGAVSTN